MLPNEQQSIECTGEAMISDAHRNAEHLEVMERLCIYIFFKNSC